MKGEERMRREVDPILALGGAKQTNGAQRAAPAKMAGVGQRVSAEAAKGVDAALDVIPPQRFLSLRAISDQDRLRVDCDPSAFFAQRSGRFARPRLQVHVDREAAGRTDLGRRLRLGFEAALRRRRAEVEPMPRKQIENWLEVPGAAGIALPPMFLHGNWASDRLLLLVAVSMERHGCRRCAEFVGDMAEMVMLGDRGARRKLMMAMARKVPMIEDRLTRLAMQSFRKSPASVTRH